MQAQTQKTEEKKVLFQYKGKPIYEVQQPKFVDLPNGKIKQKSIHQLASTFTALIYFYNGYTNGFNSHSWKTERKLVLGLDVLHNQHAFNSLCSLIEERDFKGKYKTAAIYYNPLNIKIISWAHDKFIDKMNFDFPIQPNGDVLLELKKARVDNPQYNIAENIKASKYKY